MKYWRVVRKWALAKYGVSWADLDLLFFLYGEGLFSNKDFYSFSFTLIWDKTRFPRLKREGWITQWRAGETGRHRALFEVSTKGKKMIGAIYRKLSGQDAISENMEKNPMYKASAPPSQKAMRAVIERMNKDYDRFRVK